MMKGNTGHIRMMAVSKGRLGTPDPHPAVFIPRSLAFRPTTDQGWRPRCGASRKPLGASVSPCVQWGARRVHADGRRGCLPSQICSHMLLPGGSATCPGETGRSKDTWDTVGNVLLLVTNDSIEPARSSLWPVRLPTYCGAAITAVSTATTLLGRPRPGRSRNSQGAGQCVEIDFRVAAERPLTWR